MKKGPLSTKDKKFIDKNLSMEIDALAARLDRSISSVEKYLSSKDEGVKSEPKQEQQNTSGNLFARNKDHGVVVMTEAASMAADESKKINNSSLDSRKYRNVIHTIKKD